MNSGPRSYLVEDPSRERSAVRILIELPFMAESVVGQLGLEAGFSWFLLDINKNRLHKDGCGDVDILAGRLEWNDPEEFRTLLHKERMDKAGWHPSQIAFITAITLASRGGLKWPPPTNWLVGIEAKCGYLDPEANSVSSENFKSMKAGKVQHIRAQVQDLVGLGFERVALLDVVANPPVSGHDGQAWFDAADLAEQSRRASSRLIENRLASDSPAGHYVWSIGAVAGGHEGHRGAGRPVELKAAHENLLLSKDPSIKRRRAELEENLRKIFERLPKPLNLRVIYEDCGSCGRIHLFDSPCKP